MKIQDLNFEVFFNLCNDLKIDYFKNSHDTDSVGYIIKNNEKEIVYVTDTGYINVKNLKKINNKEKEQ